MKDEPEARTDLSQSWPVRAWRLFWLTILVAHLILSSAWWWLEPGGFAVNHSRFWANSVAPVFGLGLSIGSLTALHFECKRALRWLLPVWPAAWVGAAFAGRWLFPITLREPLADSPGGLGNHGNRGISTRTRRQQANFCSRVRADPLCGFECGGSCVDPAPTSAAHPAEWTCSSGRAQVNRRDDSGPRHRRHPPWLPRHGSGVGRIVDRSLQPTFDLGAAFIAFLERFERWLLERVRSESRSRRP